MDEGPPAPLAPPGPAEDVVAVEDQDLNNQHILAVSEALRAAWESTSDVVEFAKRVCLEAAEKRRVTILSRCAVLASLARLRFELYARQAKRARHQDDDAAAEEEEEEEEQVGVLRGVLAFDIIHSDDLWRHILEFV